MYKIFIICYIYIVNYSQSICIYTYCNLYHIHLSSVYVYNIYACVSCCDISGQIIRDEFLKRARLFIWEGLSWIPVYINKSGCKHSQLAEVGQQKLPMVTETGGSKCWTPEQSD